MVNAQIFFWCRNTSPIDNVVQTTAECKIFAYALGPLWQRFYGLQQINSRFNPRFWLVRFSSLRKRFNTLQLMASNCINTAPSKSWFISGQEQQKEKSRLHPNGSTSTLNDLVLFKQWPWLQAVRAARSLYSLWLYHVASQHPNWWTHGASYTDNAEDTDMMGDGHVGTRCTYSLYYTQT